MWAEPVKIVKTRRDAPGPGTRCQPRADHGWPEPSRAAPSASGGRSGDMTRAMTYRQMRLLFAGLARYDGRLSVLMARLERWL